MKLVRSATIRLFFLVFGIVCVTYYTVDVLLYQIQCSTKFDVNKYENVTYLPRKNNSQLSFNTSLLPGTDYNNLFNTSFAFTISNSVCDNPSPMLLILIYSAPINFAQRKVIRETWGRSVDGIKSLFLLGAPDDAETQRKLENENFLYNDLLQGNFADRYRNLTYKHVMGFKYVVYHCSRVKYVLKVDDDTCVNMQLLKNFLVRDISGYGAENLLMCNVVYNARVKRGYRSKWRVGLEEYPNAFYPTYCLGWYILYSSDMVFRLYKEAQRTEYFWIEDVFITGMLTEKINFSQHTDLSPMTLSRYETRNINKCRVFLFARADMEVKEIRGLWDNIIRNPVAETVMKRNRWI